MSALPREWYWSDLGRDGHPVAVATQSESRPSLTFRGLAPSGRLSLGPAQAGRFARALPGDTVFSKQGHVTGWVLKKVGLVGDQVGVIHAAGTLQVVRPSLKVEAKWLYYWLSAPSTYNMVQDMLGGRSSITSPLLSSIPVPVAPLAQQRRIVDILEDHLSRLDAADMYLEHALSRRKVLASAWLEVMASSGGSVAIQEVIRDARTGWDRARSFVTDADDGHVYLKMGNITQENELDLASVVRVQGSAEEAGRYRLEVGDVVFNNRNSRELVGKCAVTTTDVSGWTYNNNLLRLRCDPVIDPMFLVMQMSMPSFRRQIAKITSASTNVAAIYTRDLMRLQVKLPEREVQRMLVSEYAKVSGATGRLRLDVADARRRRLDLRRALLAAAFSGRLSGRASDMDVAEEMAAASAAT